MPTPAGGRGKGIAKGGKRKSQSMQSRAGLQFPVSRIRNLMRRFGPSKLGSRSAVYVTAVLEYVVAEVLELSSAVAREHKRTRITPRQIMLALYSDEEMRRFVTKTAIIRGGGACPGINEALLSKSSKKR